MCRFCVWRWFWVSAAAFVALGLIQMFLVKGLGTSSLFVWGLLGFISGFGLSEASHSRLDCEEER